MKVQTFYDLYLKEKQKSTPAQRFVKEVATLTHRSEVTVRLWLSGVQTPDELVKATIAKRFGVDVDGLFPRKEDGHADKD